MGELLDIAQAAVEAAQRAGADFCDAYCSDATEVSVEVEHAQHGYPSTLGQFTLRGMRREAPRGSGSLDLALADLRDVT